jgi:hypothetical protein
MFVLIVVEMGLHDRVYRCLKRSPVVKRRWRSVRKASKRCSQRLQWCALRVMSGLRAGSMLLCVMFKWLLTLIKAPWVIACWYGRLGVERLCSFATTSSRDAVTAPTAAAVAEVPEAVRQPPPVQQQQQVQLQTQPAGNSKAGRKRLRKHLQAAAGHMAAPAELAHGGNSSRSCSVQDQDSTEPTSATAALAAVNTVAARPLAHAATALAGTAAAAGPTGQAVNPAGPASPGGGQRLVAAVALADSAAALADTSSQLQDQQHKQEVSNRGRHSTSKKLGKRTPLRNAEERLAGSTGRVLDVPAAVLAAAEAARVAATASDIPEGNSVQHSNSSERSSSCGGAETPDNPARSFMSPDDILLSNNSSSKAGTAAVLALPQAAAAPAAAAAAATGNCATASSSMPADGTGSMQLTTTTSSSSIAASAAVHANPTNQRPSTDLLAPYQPLLAAAYSPAAAATAYSPGAAAAAAPVLQARITPLDSTAAALPEAWHAVAAAVTAAAVSPWRTGMPGDAASSSAGAEVCGAAAGAACAVSAINSSQQCIDAAKNLCAVCRVGLRDVGLVHGDEMCLCVCKGCAGTYGCLKSNSVMRLATATVETSSDYC